MTPFITTLVTFRVVILGIGPIVHGIKLGMVSVVEMLVHLPLGIGGFFIGESCPLLVLTGLHHTLASQTRCWRRARQRGAGGAGPHARRRIACAPLPYLRVTAPAACRHSSRAPSPQPRAAVPPARIVEWCARFRCAATRQRRHARR